MRRWHRAGRRRYLTHHQEEGLTMATTVIHVRDMQPGDVYIGRGAPRAGLPRSPWANPYHIGEDGTRDQVVAKYRDRLTRMPGLLERLPELHGKRLACWCAPKPCHGDVLAELADTAHHQRDTAGEGR